MEILISNFSENIEKTNWITIKLNEKEIKQLKKLENTYKNLQVYICNQNSNWYYKILIQDYVDNLKTDIFYEDNIYKNDEHGYGYINKFNSNIELIKKITNNCRQISIMPV
jgi:hypothetical protein